MTDDRVYEREVKAAEDKLHEMEEEVNDLKVSYDYSNLKTSFAPYEMQDQIHMMDKMILRKSLKNEWTGHIENYGSFMSFMKEFDTFEKKEGILKEQAMRIVVIERAIKRTNTYIKENRELLPNALLIRESPELFSLAHEYLRKIPSFNSFDKQDYRTAIIRQAMTDLSEENIKKAIDHHVIRLSDVKGLPAAISPATKEEIENYKKSFSVISEAFKEVAPPVKDKDVINTRVTGVSFANPDGTKRQDIIRNLFDKKTPFPVELKRGTYKDKPCIEVRYDEKTLGYVPQAVVDTLTETYDDCPMTAKITEVTGGFEQSTEDGKVTTASFGCKLQIEVELVRNDFKEELKEQEEKEVKTETKEDIDKEM